MQSLNDDRQPGCHHPHRFIFVLARAQPLEVSSPCLDDLRGAYVWCEGRFSHHAEIHHQCIEPFSLYELFDKRKLLSLRIKGADDDCLWHILSPSVLVQRASGGQ